VPRPPLSVVVPTRDRPAHLRSCLAALRRELAGADELLVVDSASATKEPADLAQELGARVVVADRPGASHARNLGWRAASHELIAFVDDDVEVLTGWADAMADALSRDGTAFVTGWIGVAPHQQHLPEPNPVLLRPDGRVLDRDAEGALGATANCGFRRSALDAVGGFSERLGPGTWAAAAEDQELFDRTLAAGYVGYYEPAARVYHDQWRTRRQALALHWRYGKGMGVRLALLRRLDRRRCGRVAREVLWDDGLCSAGRAVRSRYRGGVAFAFLRLAGTVVGFAVGTVRR
jgi:GT2 family glycosyltransferase